MQNPIFEALDRSIVERRALPLGQPLAITGPEGDLGITVSAFAVPGKVPLYLESKTDGDLSGAPDETIGLEFSAGGKSFPLHSGLRRIDAARSAPGSRAPACCSSTARSGAMTK